MIKPGTIQEILDTTRIEEVIGDFVSLRKRGSNFVGLCPFHNERTPSFNVSATKGIYKCFGCGKAGNAVNFIMEHEHYSYPEALKYLASKYHIQVEEEEQTPESQQAQNEQESLFHITAFAQKYFSDKLLLSEEGKAVGLSYLKERGFREDTITKFQLGYNPDKWDVFTQHAIDNGYKLEYLVKTGLTISTDDGKTYDRFRGRVIFPIHSPTGRITGFGGRIMTADPNKPKYVNSPESEIYNKSKILYGIFFAKNAIISKDVCCLVEGYTDVISMHQAGMENVVASSGTSLTEDQIKLIKRYTRNITIIYDGDPAGIKASFRGIDMILEQGLNVKVVLLPDGEDPDSFVRKNRIAEVEKFVNDNTYDFIIFKTKLLINDASGDPIKKATLIKDIVSSIAKIPDGIFRSVYIKECSAVMDVSEQTLFNELNKILRYNFNKKLNATEREVIPEATEFTSERQETVDSDTIEYQERDIIRLLLLYGWKEIPPEGLPDREDEVITVAEFIIHDLIADEISFHNPFYQYIFDQYVLEMESKGIPGEKFFTFHPDPNISKLSIDLITTPYELSDHWEKKMIAIKSEKERMRHTVVSSLLAFKAKKVEKLILQTQKEIKEAHDEEESVYLLHKLQNLNEVSGEINFRLGRVITK
ncbi:MAG: DNA primase [Bacteroidetes bacterium]|nr:DNA primase [Bacteroidota bacterium]